MLCAWRGMCASWVRLYWLMVWVDVCFWYG